ncbi:MAG: 2-polyprenyl-3-methyl-6-methoxy-1,4-benzoquinone monooxygenase [Acidiferrobacteraceae bacterium]
MRSPSAVDFCIDQLDHWLRRLSGTEVHRARPDEGLGDDLNEDERRLSGRVMRVNHAGEVAAQALYQGQAMTARSAALRVALNHAAREEADHLAWTGARLSDLDTHKSYLNPAWYLGALVIGAAAGVAGDKWSLGFIAETERQVVEHLGGEIAKLPVRDEKSRAILTQMRADEARHATTAMEAGGRMLPMFIREGMRLAARVMVETAYWV